MNIRHNDPPREFEVGFGPRIIMKDCGQIELAADEQITLRTESAGEYDVARKCWGFYATPSINGRLERFGFRTALTKNRLGQFFVMLVEKGREPQFDDYVQAEGLHVCGWLDSETLSVIDAHLTSLRAA